MSDSNSLQTAPLPLISFVICGRNDNYMGNYGWRITTAMNLLIRNLARLGLQKRAEIILADWNSPVPFHEEMKLPPEARDLMRFMVVPPAIAIPAQKDSKFPNPIAQNAAIRRARGTFVAVSDADVILTPSCLMSLVGILEGKIPIGSPAEKTFLMAGRVQIPTIRTMHNPPLDEIESFIQHNRALLKRDRLFEGLGAPAGLVVLHRDLWLECRGYDERLIHYGWGDIELHLRVSQRYPWVDLTNFGAEAIHIEHYSGPRGSGPPPRKSNGYPVARRIAVNDEHWGLGNETLHMHAPEAVMNAAASAQVAQASQAMRSQPYRAASIAAEFQQPEINKLLETVLKSLPHPPEEHDLLRILAWYAINRHPRTYLELGVQRSSAPAVVVAAAPTCECYLVDQWAEDDSGGNPPIYHAANTVGAVVPQAQTHFITGDMTSAVSRLFELIAPGLQLDLAVIRTSSALGDPTKNAMAVADHLAPGGALVLNSHDPSAFAPIWNKLTARTPNYIHFQISRTQGVPPHLGFILAASAAP